MNGHKPESASLLDGLTQKLAQDAKVLNEYYASNAHPAPSFAHNAPVSSVAASAPLEVKIARDRAMNSALEIFDLLAGPTKFLSNLTNNYQTLACLRWLIHFKVLKNVPLENSISYEELASKTGVPEAALKSIARMATTSHLLYEPAPGQVAHSALSHLLATSDPLHNWAAFTGDEALRIAIDMVEATEKYGEGKGIHGTSFNVAMKTDESFFEFMKKRPHYGKMYAEYQKAVATTEGLDLGFTVRGFDWAGLGKATVVDVAGSIGLASIALAKDFPELDFIVQELPEVVTEGQNYLSTTISDSSITSRIRYEAYDFFNPQPVKGAEIYLLRMILHYWSLEDSVKIIRQIVPAMTPGKSKIIIMDTVMPAPGTVGVVQERQFRVRDLAMMQLHGSHEREVEDWEKIYKEADPRLRLKKPVSMPFGSELAVMELILEEGVNGH